MSSSDKSKLDNIATNANNYSLPTATATTLGGVKVGSNITNSSGTISLSKANVVSALGYEPSTIKKQIFTTDGIFIVPENVTQLIVTAVGGGGGGCSLFGSGGRSEEHTS